MKIRLISVKTENSSAEVVIDEYCDGFVRANGLHILVVSIMSVV